MNFDYLFRVLICRYILYLQAFPASFVSEEAHIYFYICSGAYRAILTASALSRFDFVAVRSHSKVANANRMRLHMLAYNLFNCFR